MNLKRKSIALLLALVMCLGLTVPAFARPWDVEWAESTIGDTATVDGVTITIADGTLSFAGSGSLKSESVDAAIYRYCIRWCNGNPVTVIVESGLKLGWDNKSEFEDYLVTEITMGSGYEEGTVSFTFSYGADSAPAVQTVGGFTDVKTGDYFADPVLWAVEKGITSGTSKTTFSPGENCTVAQILTFLWRANGSPKPAGSNPFSDVKDSDYYCSAALWAYEKGIVSGETFGGDRSCTRSMAVTYMWKAAGSISAQSTINFTDVPAAADYAGAVAWAVEKGITAGTSATSFSPDNVCTRGQIVTFLHRDLAK